MFHAPTNVKIAKGTWLTREGYIFEVTDDFEIVNDGTGWTVYEDSVVTPEPEPEPTPEPTPTPEPEPIPDPDPENFNIFIRVVLAIGRFFKSIGKAIWRFIKKVLRAIKRLLKRIVNIFKKGK